MVTLSLQFYFIGDQRERILAEEHGGQNPIYFVSGRWCNVRIGIPSIKWLACSHEEKAACSHLHYLKLIMVAK